MARDFMGLKSKDAMVVVKEEVETSTDSDYPKGSGVPWPSSSKVSALPHFTSFKTAQDEKPPKLASGHLGPPEFMDGASGNGYDITNKHQPAGLQTTRPLCHGFMMPPYSMGNPLFKTLLPSDDHNFANANMKQQFPGGISVTNPYSVLPSSGFFAGTTEPQLSSSAPVTPAQLTIFYAGKIHVFDDISLEKARAIICLAGNGANSSNVAQPKVHVQVSSSRLAAEDGGFVNQFMNTQVCSTFSSPMSISSYPIGQTIIGSADNDEIKASKIISIPSTVASKLEISSQGPAPANTLMPSAVPQARKASLARFLEMRKERVMNSSPYRLNKKYAEHTNAESKNADLSPSSGAGSNSVSTGKETSRDV